jgi:hypothetical protein
VPLRNLPLASGEHAGRHARLAFWINAYNDLVIAGIQEFGIRDSVWEIPDFFDRPSCSIDGQIFSLNDIEHGVLRGNRPNPLSGLRPFAFDDPRAAHALIPPDPRIHFAINCGARSCPPTRRFDTHGLEGQLEAAARNFVTREVYLAGDALVASLIFKWFADDFAEQPGGLAGFLAAHLEDGPVRRAVLAGGTERITWREYDWRLPESARAEKEQAR